ncbi:MAG: hypothetical protein ACI8P0_000623 [Planctomycetaceae bacterium]|jgi:hypothetical protein
MARAIKVERISHETETSHRRPAIARKNASKRSAVANPYSRFRFDRFRFESLLAWSIFLVGLQRHRFVLVSSPKPNVENSLEVAQNLAIVACTQT